MAPQPPQLASMPATAAWPGWAGMRAFGNFAHRTAELVVFFAAIGLLWEAAVRYFEIRAYLLPAPSAIWGEIVTSHAMLWEHTLITAGEVLVGFVCAVAAGVVIAAGIFFIPVVQRTVYPLIVAVQGIPKVALAPLIVVWFGYGIGSKVIMAFLFAFFPIVISTLGGLQSVPDHLMEHFRAIRASSWFTFRKLQFPYALPNFIDGCKVAMPLAVIGAVVGEFVGSSQGLGNLIMLGTGSARTALTFAAIGAVTVLSLVLYGVIEFFGRLAWWRSK
jgi:NitT/TauT family transport system permease protein